MRYELEIGLRYTRSGRSSRFVNFISGMATLGIGLGVAALIIVLSVMNGFQKEVRDRMLGVLSHVELVAGAYDDVDWDKARALLNAQPGVEASAPFVLGQAMVAQGNQLKALLVRGIDPAEEADVSVALRSLPQGKLSDLQPGKFGVIVGREFANQRNIAVGDRLLLVTADAASGPAGVVPRLKSFEVRGIFSTGHFDYDSNLALMHADDALTLFRAQSLRGVRARLANVDRAPFISEDLRAQVPVGLVPRDWTSENRTWFAAVQLEKRMMFIILTLIIAVAAFNLVSMLVMTVMDKRSDIAILRTLGARRGSILAVFMIQGTVLGVGGVLLGVVLGVLGAWQVDALVSGIESLLGSQLLPKGVYLIDKLPSDLRLADVLQIASTAMVLALLATIYPAWQAAKTHPAEALRYD